MSSALQPLEQKPLRVLVVEDSEDDALLVRRHLRRAGYATRMVRVETAESMRQALRSAGDSWDVVLADYTLPNFSAPAALQLLKREGLDLPFIMMSGAVSEETAVEAMRAGAHDYVSKQNLTRLVPAIERELAEAQARRQRREAEQALRASEERFHRLVQALPLGLLISDQSGRLLYANDAFERLLGYTQADIRMGAITLAAIVEDENATILARHHEMLQGERAIEPFEAQCRTRDHGLVPMLVGLTLLSPETNGGRQVAAYFVDLTERKRGEEVMRRTEKLAATGRLAASIAHEINNPLEAVMNCLYLISMHELDPAARTYLTTAQNELNRVTQISMQMLRFYRQNTRPVETQVNELLETVIALYEVRARSFGIGLERRYGDLPSIVAFDGEIRQVLANLVGNALDAMHSGGGRLLIKTGRGRNWKTGEPGVVVTVADTGSGMDKATIARAFEPFFSTKGATGTGLGLWVSQTIVEKHRGSIGVRSRPGQGTAFRVFLPLSLAASSGREWEGSPSGFRLSRIGNGDLEGGRRPASRPLQQ